jgi:hypothetical protein
METSRREQRIGYVVAVLLALFITGWLAFITAGAMHIVSASPSPAERDDVNW